MVSLMRASLNVSLVRSARTFAAGSVEIDDIAGIGILNHRLLPIQSVFANCGELHMAVTASRGKRLLQENSVGAKSRARSQDSYEQCGQQWSLNRHYSSPLCLCFVPSFSGGLHFLAPASACCRALARDRESNFSTSELIEGNTRGVRGRGSALPLLPVAESNSSFGCRGRAHALVSGSQPDGLRLDFRRRSRSSRQYPRSRSS